MTDTTIGLTDSAGNNRAMKAYDPGDGSGLEFYHREDATQRTALITALGLLANHTDITSLISAIQGTLNVTGPLTAAQLGSASLATHSDMTALATAIGLLATHTDMTSLINAISGTLQVSGPLTAAQLTSAALATHADVAALTTAVQVH